MRQQAQAEGARPAIEDAGDRKLGLRADDDRQTTDTGQRHAFIIRRPQGSPAPDPDARCHLYPCGATGKGHRLPLDPRHDAICRRLGRSRI